MQSRSCWQSPSPSEHKLLWLKKKLILQIFVSSFESGSLQPLDSECTSPEYKSSLQGSFTRLASCSRLIKKTIINLLQDHTGNSATLVLQPRQKRHRRRAQQTFRLKLMFSSKITPNDCKLVHLCRLTIQPFLVTLAISLITISTCPPSNCTCSNVNFLYICGAPSPSGRPAWTHYICKRKSCTFAMTTWALSASGRGSSRWVRFANIQDLLPVHKSHWRPSHSFKIHHLFELTKRKTIAVVALLVLLDTCVIACHYFHLLLECASESSLFGSLSSSGLQRSWTSLVRVIN